MTRALKSQLAAWRAGQSAPPAAPVAPAGPATPAVDLASLKGRQYLRSDEAAAYLGYTADRYADPLQAFHQAIARIPNHRRPRKFQREGGRRVMFLRKDLDQAFAPPDAALARAK